MNGRDVRGGFWPDMTGGMCAPCHIAVGHGNDPDPTHPVCLVVHDGMRITRHATDEVLLHLPQWTYWDTQAWSAEVGIPTAHLPALKAVLDAYLAQQAADALQGRADDRGVTPEGTKTGPTIRNPQAGTPAPADNQADTEGTTS